MNNFYKLLTIIVIWNEKQTDWPYEQNYFKTSRYFNRKPYHLFFSSARKTGKVPEFEFDQLLKTIFWRWYKSKIYIVTTNALDFKQLYIFYKFYLINEYTWPSIFTQKAMEYTYLKEFHIWQNLLPVQFKNSYLLPSLCVLCFTGKTC